MVIIKNEWYGKNVRIKNVCDKIFYGGVVEITRKENNSETNRDSLSIYDGKNYIFFSDNEIKEIETLEDENQIVIPACAGVIRRASTITVSAWSNSRMRGGDPVSFGKPNVAGALFPHTRGNQGVRDYTRSNAFLDELFRIEMSLGINEKRTFRTMCGIGTERGQAAIHFGI